MEERAVTLSEILEARDCRAKRQRELLIKYKRPLLSFTMNAAGPVKNSPLLRWGFQYGRELLAAQLGGIPCLHSEFLDEFTVTGCEGLYVLEIDPLELKRLAVEIEDTTSVGRLFDMDVLELEIDNNIRHIGRESLGLPERRCLLCDKPARECARSRTHSVEELQTETKRLLQLEFSRQKCEKIACSAVRALLYEAAVTPKPGLVDCHNNGSHKDMNLFSFLSSATVLWPYFYRCAMIGVESAKEKPSETFYKLRFPGKQAERQMYAITGGVNTHKGAIFSLGILCGALGRLDEADWECGPNECATMTCDLIENDFRGITMDNARTTGEKLFAQYGLTGVRGQVEAGFPAVLDAGLPVLEQGLARGLSLNDAGRVALLKILTSMEDTNLIARSDRETQQRVSAEIADLLKETPFPDRETIEALDRSFIEQNLSPGGSADLLAVTYFLHFIKKGC